MYVSYEPSKHDPSLTSAATTAANTHGQVVDPLQFPPFHRSIMSQNYWEASDQVGRIRVELSMGYAEPKSNAFVKVVNLVNFAFQPAPMGKSAAFVALFGHDSGLVSLVE